MKNESVMIYYSSFFAPESFYGDKCSVCDDPIYGDGFRLISATTTDTDPLPKFKSFPFIVCESCKDKALKY